MSPLATSEKIYIRADGNAKIGYGHLMRSLAFATHAKSLTDVVLFIRHPDEFAINACESYKIQCVDISDVPLEKEALFLAETIPSKSVLFIDGYQFDEAYLRQISSNGAYLMCMDDHHDRYFPSGCIINIAELKDPSKVKRNIGTKLVYGLSYALIRPEFEPFHQSRNSTVFICFGGGNETEDIIKKTINAIIESACTIETIQVVVNKQLQADLQLWREEHYPQKEVEVLSQLGPVEMNQLMNNACLGISSSSTVALECRASGLPLIAGYFVDNQMGMYDSLLSTNEITGAGNLKTISEKELAQLIQTKLTTLAEHQENSVLQPKNIRSNYQRLIQACSIERDFTLRKAEEKDVMLYLNWANEPEVRRNAINSQPIVEENHRKWFSSRLASKSTILLVGMWQQEEVGQVRFDEHDGAWEIDYSVSPAFQRKGFGELLIRKGMEYLKQTTPQAECVIGMVKPENSSSIRVFQKLHFIEAEALVKRDGVELHSFSFPLGA